MAQASQAVPESYLDWMFPIYGLHIEPQFAFQEIGWTPLALNVRAYDPLLMRERGGARPGLVPFIDAFMNGVGPTTIQDLNILPTFVQPATNSISGNVSNNFPGSIPLEGVVVNLTGTATASTTTDASGNYSFANLPPGTYTVTEIPTPGSGALEYTSTSSSVGTINGSPGSGTAVSTVISGIVLAGGSVAIDYNFNNTYQLIG